MTLRTLVVTLAVVVFARGARVASAQESITLGGRSVVVWAPRASGSAREPVLIFSHGFGGCAGQSKFLTATLAARGYWVFAPNHKDARCGGSRSGGGRPDAPFRKPEEWSEKSFADRRDDIRAMLDALATDTRYSSHVDLGRLGVIGHSLGGYTVVGLAGGWPSWKTGAPKAVLALSPYVEPYLVHGTLNGVSAPIMYQGGTLDFGITPSIRKDGGVYDASPTPKYFVDFARAGHLAWTDLRPALHDEINEYAIAFLDHYVLGTPAASVLTHATASVSALWYDSELGRVAGGGSRRRR